MSYLEKNNNVGAVASRVMLPPPENSLNLIQSWQYGDFLYQKLFDWPAEVISGYLTVLPGQFCIFRMSSLAHGGYWESNNLKVEPLDFYFRGLKNLGPFESNMFLAEDRVLGYEIISKSNSKFILSYLPEAPAITDTCETLSELFQQRRRWINSTFFCNLWIILNIFKNVIFSDAKPKAKTHSLFTLIWLSYYCVSQFFYPALIVIIIKIASGSLPFYFDVSLQTISVEKIIVPLFVISMFIQVIVFSSKRIFNNNLKLIKFTIYFQLVIVTSTLLMFGLWQGIAVHKNIDLLIIFAAELFGFALLSIIYSKRVFYEGMKNILQFFFMRPIMLLILGCYSFCNIHDVSWGTKGLANNRNGFTLFRFVFQSTWIMSNILLVLWFYHQIHFNNFFLFNTILFLIITFVGFKMMAGLYFAIRYWFKNK